MKKLCRNFAVATLCRNRLVFDKTSCLDNPDGQVSFLWMVSAWCRYLPFGHFYFKKTATPNECKHPSPGIEPIQAPLIPLPSPARLPQLYYFF
jgi:hypothetical protein